VVIENIGNLMDTEPADQREGTSPGSISSAMWQYANNRDSSYRFEAGNKYAPTPAIDLLLESPNRYILEVQSMAMGSSATALYRAATAEHDLQTLGDDILSGGVNDTGDSLYIPIGTDDPLANLLTESPVAAPL